MSDSVIDRLSNYMEIKQLNDNIVTDAAGLSNGQIGKAKKKKTGLRSDSIEKILYAYPDLNPAWLLTGKGEMILNTQIIDDPSKVDEGYQGKNANESQIEIIELYKELIKCKDEILKLKSENEKQRRVIDALKGIEKELEIQVKELEETVHHYEEQISFLKGTS